MAEDRPFIRIHVAISADGKIASANRAVDSFSSRRDHAHLLELRTHSDAVLCGAGTANVPGVTLGTGGPRWEQRRMARGRGRHPLRVVVSGRAGLRPDADVFGCADGPLIVVVGGGAPAGAVEVLSRRAEVAAFGQSEVDLPRAMSWLRRERGVRSLVCEGGAALNDAMFRAGLVDEVHVTVCPRIIGGRDAPTLAEGLGVPALSAATLLELRRRARVEDELFLVYRVARAAGAHAQSSDSRA